MTAQKIVLVIAPENFRDEELFDTQEELENAGIKTTIASKKRGLCRGKLGKTAHAQSALSEIKVSDYDGIVFVGGGGVRVYFEDPEALKLAQDFFAARKWTTAICAGPGVLARAGLLTKKNVTSHESVKDLIQATGARWTGQDVETDGKIVTANGPAAAHAFGKKIAEQLANRP